MTERLGFPVRTENPILRDEAVAIGAVERLLFRRVPLWTLLLLLLLAPLCAIGFGTVLTNTLSGNKRFGAIGEVAVTLANIPALLRNAASAENPMLVSEDRGHEPGGLTRSPKASFIDPGYLLVARYAPEQRRSVVELLRLADGAVLREYSPDIAAINRRSQLKTAILDLHRDRSPERYRLKHPLLMPDGGIVFHNSSPLVRVDACGLPVWTLDGIFHHSIERDSEGALWVPVTKPRSGLRNVSEKFQEDGIARVSPEGQLLHEESLVNILLANGMGPLYEGALYVDDPLHLNDIEPVLADGPHWRRGDLFLSVRNLSLVLLYRPSTRRVLWWKQGPWQGQHDVNILDDHRISVFDNHSVGGFPADYVRGNNRIIVYNFANDSISAPFEAVLKRLDVRTVTEGRGTPLPGGDFMIEESNFGRVLRISPDGNIRWRYIAADGAGRRYLLAWTRYLDPEGNQSAIQAATKENCP